MQYIAERGIIEAVQATGGQQRMYYSTIGLLAALILLIINRDILFKHGETFNKHAWTVYRRFLLAVMAYYITDILWGILESLRLNVLLFADTTVYYAAMGAGVLFWAEFTVAYLDEKDLFGTFLVYAGRTIAAVIAILAAVNILKPVIFTVDSACVYHALPARYMMLVCQITLLLLISVYSFSSYLRKGGRHAMRRRYRALGLFGLIMAACLFIQLWFPFLPLYSIAYMLGTCLLNTLVVSDEKEEYRRGLEEAEKITDLNDTISSLLDNMPGITFTKDAVTGAYLACNRSFAEYAGKTSQEEVTGLTAAQLFDAKMAAQIAADDRMALSMDEPYVFFDDVTDARGNQRQMQNTKRKYTDALGRDCILGICQDVTDMVRIQRENATTKEAYEKARSTGIIYSHIAQALARSYSDLYYVNLDSEEFTEYLTEDESGLLTEARRGYHFFEECRIEAEEHVHPGDRDALVEALDRKTLVAALDRHKTFVMTYRLLTETGSRYVTMKVSRMEDDDRFIIIGVTDVDEQMKQRRESDRMKEEETAYARLNALAGDYICIYVVVPETGRYREFSSGIAYEQTFGQPKEGRDFFAATTEAVRKFVHPEDLSRFLNAFTEENVKADIEKHGIFTVSYRLMMEGEPVYVQLKAAMVDEKEGRRLIVGLSNIDAQVRQEEEYVRSLAKARIEANIDALTGVKNRRSYLMAEARLNDQIADNNDPHFAIVILDVNDLKRINDTEGHEAGDRYIRDACRLICNIFKHSPVFRVGGDEFAVIAQGRDYSCIEQLIGQVNDHNAEAVRNGGIVIACGMAKREDDDSVAPVFERADQNMYENKSNLKSEKSRQ